MIAAPTFRLQLKMWMKKKLEDQKKVELLYKKKFVYLKFSTIWPVSQYLL